ncbi:MAG: hypothetical protein J0H01_37885 [Rhizobiales bacterium]|nr:hypothetical protein [Hyphomicrobiales bacterium]
MASRLHHGAEAGSEPAEWLKPPTPSSTIILVFTEADVAALRHPMQQIHDAWPMAGTLLVRDAARFRANWLSSRPDSSCARTENRSRPAALLREIARNAILIVINTDTGRPLDWLGSVFGHIVLETFVAPDISDETLAAILMRQTQIALTHSLRHMTLI